jgi:hypothetical protein
MSFIRRSDGTVVYARDHVESRGSLESIHYGNNLEDISTEDKEWELRVLASVMTYKDSFYTHESDGLNIYDIDLVECLWGIYGGDCPHLIKNKDFNEKYFSPSGR